jgi:hypothetical protein
VFVPWSQSRNKDEKEINYTTGKPSDRPQRSLNWKVQLLGPRGIVAETDYMAGIGNCPSYKSFISLYVEEELIFETEQGFKARRTALGMMRGDPILPNALDVIHCLVTDADAINYTCFEDWAESCGYETDSRKAEKIYNACLQIALTLRNTLGDDNLKKLQEAAQDY